MARVFDRFGTEVISVFPAMPFAALTGYEAALGETARLSVERRELDAQEAEELNRREIVTNTRDSRFSKNQRY